MESVDNISILVGIYHKSHMTNSPCNTLITGGLDKHSLGILNNVYKLQTNLYPQANVVYL